MEIRHNFKCLRRTKTRAGIMNSLNSEKIPKLLSIGQPLNTHQVHGTLKYVFVCRIWPRILTKIADELIPSDTTI